jgi:hypothetical protein
MINSTYKFRNETTHLVASKPPIKQYFEALIAPSGPCSKFAVIFNTQKY